MHKHDLKSYTRAELKEAVKTLGFEAYRADQIFEWVYKGAREIDAMKNLSKPQKDKLKKEGYYISSLKTVKKAVSKLDGTTKFLFELEDGEKIESVILPDMDRTSLCVSSQAGCACNCGFCATGALGIKRDLSAGEIVGQFIAASGETGRKIDSMVFMGMGEPFLNWENVSKAITILADEKGYNFSQKRITVSTIGVVPVIKEIADKKYKFKLAISLISADDSVRSRLVPMNKKYALKDIIYAAKYYNQKTEEPITFEYPLFKGINDSIKDADAVFRLLRGVKYKINLIPYNNTPKAGFEKPEIERVLAFQQALVDRGIKAFIRKEKGSDIAGACGQLAGGV